MKLLYFTVFGSFFLLSANGFAQVDIYQSNAYSVEEMCARQAAETNTADYSTAYEMCIKKNQDRPMYQSDADDAEDTLAGKSDAGEDAVENNL